MKLALAFLFLFSPILLPNTSAHAEPVKKNIVEDSMTRWVPNQTLLEAFFDPELEAGNILELLGSQIGPRRHYPLLSDEVYFKKMALVVARVEMGYLPSETEAQERATTLVDLRQKAAINELAKEEFYKVGHALHIINFIRYQSEQAITPILITWNGAVNKLAKLSQHPKVATLRLDNLPNDIREAFQQFLEIELSIQQGILEIENINLQLQSGEYFKEGLYFDEASLPFPILDSENESIRYSQRGEQRKKLFNQFLKTSSCSFLLNRKRPFQTGS